MTTNNSDRNWAKRNVKIIPSLIIGTGGTGVSVIRHLKRRVRLEWPGLFPGDMPDLIQFYAIDSVSYANRPDQEFLSPSEYGFLGGFDPQELIDPYGPYQSVKSWWDFDPRMLPAGLIHLGARQIRALGRLALFYGFPEVWQNIQYKIDLLNQISAGTQATRYGYDIPIETSSRQVFIVSSICGGTGAGCFLDVAARIRAKETTNLKIIGIFVLPSAFEHVLPSRRQINRTRANAYASLKELDAFWYVDPQDPYRVLYPGESEITTLQHAVFDEVYLIGRQGRGRSLADMEHVNQQIAHFLYLTTINNIADPVGERTVNFDRTTRLYSSFAVGALSLPERKLSDSLLADLKRRYLLGLVQDRRHIELKEELNDAIQDYLDDLREFANQEASHLIGASPEEVNDHVRPWQEKIVLELLRWLFGALVPRYGIGAIRNANDEVRLWYEELQDKISALEDEIEELEQEIRAAEAHSGQRNTFDRFGRFGRLLSTLFGRQTVDWYEDIIEENEELIGEKEEELPVLRLLVPDDDDSRSGARLLSYVRDILGTLDGQVHKFYSQAEQLGSELSQEKEEALQRQSDVASRRGEGREYRYYDMEIDPTLPGPKNALASLWNSVVNYNHFSQEISPSKMLRAEKGAGTQPTVIPPPTIQLLGLYDKSHGTRRTGHLHPVSEVSRFTTNYQLNVLEREEWELDSMAEELVRSVVEETVRSQAGLMQLFEQPLFQNWLRRKMMMSGLKAIVDNLMNNIKPFWGVKPFPDERQLERVRFICLAADPNANEVSSRLFREYLDHKNGYQLVAGSDPYRLDALYIEHAARPQHIGELKACKEAYDAFKKNGHEETLHLTRTYANLPDLF